MESVNLHVRNITMHMKRYNIGAEKKLVLLHGFTGSSNTWKEVIAYLPSSVEVLTVDLIGHGQTSKPNDHTRYFVEEQLADLHQLFHQLGWKDFTLLGYSMGGRLALAYATKYPVDKVILESSSPGLASIVEREKRKNLDEKLAESIRTGGMEAFVDFWEAIPLFQSQNSLSSQQRKMIRAERLDGSEVGLSNSLRGFSTGIQPSYWDMLKDIKVPTVLLTGEFDTKFCAIAKEMKENLPKCVHKEFNGVGHAIHVENPKLFATIVENIILKEDF